MTEHKLGRPYETHEGDVVAKQLDLCRCDAARRRGPEGGVCGQCNGAIPNVLERERLEKQGAECN
jgi:hypothetical protein